MNAPTYVSGGYNFSYLESHYHGNCGLLQNGSALCWGRNHYGQLGIGNTTNMNAPTYVSGGYKFTSLGGGMFHNCGLNTNGSILCWGLNTNGELGIGNTTNMNSPTYVSGGYNFSEIFIGGMNSAGVLQTGEIMFWGDCSASQLGKYLTNPSERASRILKGKLFWKDPFNFAIGYSYSGELISFNNGNELRAEMNGEWNHVVISLGGENYKLYINGTLRDNLSSSRGISQETLDIFLGNNSRGQIDEILMWNRTLTDAEINQVYLSSLQQRNHTAWEFYSTQTLPSVGTYTYSLFALDGTGSFNVIRNIIKYIVEAVTPDDSPGGINPPVTVKEEKLQEGQTRQLREGAKVKIEFANQGSKTLEVVDVNKNTNVVKVKINDIEVEVVNGTTEKIDVNGDGFYDLEVSVEDISSTGSSRLKFKEIYEEIQGDDEEAVTEEVMDDVINNEEEEVINEKSNLWKYLVVIGIVGLLIASYFMFVKKK